MIIRMVLAIYEAQSGQIRGKVSESQLIDMLGQISESKSAQSKIKVYLADYSSIGEGTMNPTTTTLDCNSRRFNILIGYKYF